MEPVRNLFSAPHFDTPLLVECATTGCREAWVAYAHADTDAIVHHMLETGHMGVLVAR